MADIYVNTNDLYGVTDIRELHKTVGDLTAALQSYSIETRKQTRQLLVLTVVLAVLALFTLAAVVVQILLA